MPKRILERDMRALEVAAAIDPTTAEELVAEAGRPAAHPAASTSATRSISSSRL
jgi:hypothetical protein